MKFEVIEQRPDGPRVWYVFDDGKAAAKWLKDCDPTWAKGKRIVPRPENALEQLNNAKFLNVPGMTAICSARIREDTPNIIFEVDGDKIKETPFNVWLKKQKQYYQAGIEDDCSLLWHQGGVDFEFARTAEEIIYVYKNSIQSCTARDAAQRGLNAKNPHPLATLGNTDIEVAYVKSKSGSRISFRCLVAPSRMIYHDGYTWGAQLIGERAPAKLRALGYRFGDPEDWKGLRIKRIPLVENKASFLIPALDVIYNLNYKVSDDGEALLLGSIPKLPCYRCNTDHGYAQKYTTF